MQRASIVLLFILVFILVFTIGIIILQIFLSKKEGKLPGLILPIICILLSLIPVFSVVSFSVTSTNEITTSDVILDDEGVLIDGGVSAVYSQSQNIESPVSFVFTILYVLLVYNIPTVILLGIYFACREKQRQRKALEKMSVQDLE